MINYIISCTAILVNQNGSFDTLKTSFSELCFARPGYTGTLIFIKIFYFVSTIFLCQLCLNSAHNVSLYAIDMTSEFLKLTFYRNWKHFVSSRYKNSMKYMSCVLVDNYFCYLFSKLEYCKSKDIERCFE